MYLTKLRGGSRHNTNILKRKRANKKNSIYQLKTRFCSVSSTSQRKKSLLCCVARTAHYDVGFYAWRRCGSQEINKRATRQTLIQHNTKHDTLQHASPPEACVPERVARLALRLRGEGPFPNTGAVCLHGAVDVGDLPFRFAEKTKKKKGGGLCRSGARW